MIQYRPRLRCQRRGLLEILRRSMAGPPWHPLWATSTAASPPASAPSSTLHPSRIASRTRSALFPSRPNPELPIALSLRIAGSVIPDFRAPIGSRNSSGKLPDRFWAPKPGKRPFSRLLYFDRNAPPFRPFDCRLRRPESRHCSRRSQAQADYFGVYVRIPPGPPLWYKTGNADSRRLPSFGGCRRPQQGVFAALDVDRVVRDLDVLGEGADMFPPIAALSKPAANASFACQFR